MLRTGSTVGMMAALALLGMSAEAQTTNPNDGRWLVVFGSGQGGCQQREAEVSVSAGQITHAGWRGLFTAHGQVGQQGHVDASIGALGHTATAQGQLTGASGSGTWSMPELVGARGSGRRGASGPKARSAGICSVRSATSC
jgi:hypothetical protein